MSRRKQLKPQQLASPSGAANIEEDDKIIPEASGDNISSDSASDHSTEKLSEESNKTQRQSPFSKEQLERCKSDSEMVGSHKSDELTVAENDIERERTSLNSDAIMGDSNMDGVNETTTHADENKNAEETEQNTYTPDDTNLDQESSIRPQMYECDHCTDAFTELGDFLQHKKQQHNNLTEESDVEDNNFNTMVNDSSVVNTETVGKNQTDQSDNVALESMDITDVDRSQMTSMDKENESINEDEDNCNEDKINVSGLPEDLKNSGFLSSNAIATVLQNVKNIENGLNLKQEIGEDGKPTGKLDINGIKDQVKMIQQQQAYQIQMLNYLHWQLAVLSSNPQAAIQHVASTMRNAIPGLPGQMHGIPPAMGAGGPAGMMPSMMAAMAMNGGNNMSLDMASKARMMMNMQSSNPQFRTMFGRNLSDENEGKNFSTPPNGFDHQHEQRYQLNEPPDIEKFSKMQHHENNIMSPSKSDERNGVSSPISAGGYDNSLIHSRQKSVELKSQMISDDLRRENDTHSNNSFKDDDSSENSAYRHRCKFCQKVFGSDSALQIHLRSHTGERPYKCNICGNRFTTKGNLKVHFMRHKAKYPHIPMNPHPVPEYLDGVPTPTGLPYGMSILPEKAVFERPRLHGNPSIHLNANVSSSSPHSGSVANGMSPLSMLSAEQAARSGFPMNTQADIAMLQQQMLERRKQMQLMEKSNNEDGSMSSPNPDKNIDGAVRDSKPTASMLQMAMMPFFKFGKQGENEMVNSMLTSEAQHIGDIGNSDGRSSYSSSGSSSPPQRRHPSETSKLQRLVENIDRGRALQKNECHMCHRVLSCQSALKLHYRTHTGERPHKCDLCSRAFTTRGNLRTHYSSVHRQQLRSLPPGGASRPGSYPCPLCHMRFFDVMEFQQHMRTHAIMQQKSQEVDTQRNSPSLENDANATYSKQADAANKHEFDNSMGEGSSFEDEENDLQIDEENLTKDSESKGEENGERNQQALDLSSPASCERSNEDIEAPDHDQNNNVKTTKTHTPSDGEHAELNRSNSKEVSCEICEKSFSCNSALEIHMRNHTKERPYLCRICQKGFSTKGNLKQHLVMHNITDAPDELLEPVSSPDDRGSNSNSPHSSISPYNRDMMSGSLKRSFDSDGSGNGPAAKQRQYPRHWCHICQKQFSSASSLQIHTRTHTGEKPFACSVCGRAFTTKGNLKVHMGTHVFGAGGSRRGRRISMDNPLISPWMQNIANNGPAAGAMHMPPQDARGDPSLLYQQYAAAIANGLLNGKSDRDVMNMNNNRLLAMNAAAGLLGQNANTSPTTSPHENGPNSPSRHRMPASGITNPAMAEWFLKAYQQRTQEQVN